MAAFRRAILAFSSLVVPLTAFVACNAVLGIEPAKEDTQGSALVCDQPSSSVPVTGECTTGDACALCIGGEVVGDCQANGPCREALGDYRECLQDDCEDDAGRCTGCITGSPEADRVRAGLTRCEAECHQSSVLSLCELYCQCMRDVCTTQDWSERSCEEACAATEVWKTHCRWGHCELARTVSMAAHCGHAAPDTSVKVNDTACETMPFLDPLCTPPGVWDGFRCDKPDDCCSGLCRDGKCVPS